MARSVRPWGHGVREALISTMPLMLMALLAVGTWWLVEQAPRLESPALPVDPVHEPDYAMVGFTLQRFDAQGVLRTQLQGEEGRHYPDTDTLEVDGISLRSVGELGEVTTARARQGWSNHNASEVRLRGQAVLVREAIGASQALRFYGESLQAFADLQRLVSEKPVVIEQQGLRVEAASFQYDHSTQIVQVRGKTKALLSGMRNQQIK